MNHLKKIWLGFSVMLVILGILQASPLHASAVEIKTALASDYNIPVVGNDVSVRNDEYILRWIDAAHLELSFKYKPGVEVIFEPRDDGDHTPLVDQRNDQADLDYTIPGWPCYSNAHAGSSIDKEVQKIDIDIDFKASSVGECDNAGTVNNVQAKDTALSVSYFKWVDPAQITTVDGESPGLFKQTDPAFPNIYVRTSENGEKCQDKILVDHTKNTARLFELATRFSGTPPPEIQPGNCKYIEEKIGNFGYSADYLMPITNNKEMTIANTAALTLPPNSVTVSTANGGNVDDTCESKSGAMGWILCPVINLLDGGLNWVDTQVQGLLEIDKSKYVNDDLKAAWTSIRNIAYFVLIPIMLVMVIGTALGLDAFNAYTIKKALPRMVVAVIFITFSWYICTFVIQFFNVVGGGILGIITQPFRESLPSSCANGNLNLSCLFSVQNGVNGGSILRSILFLPSAAASIVGLILFLIFFGSTLLIAIGAAFIVLLARQMFVIALMLVAPLAILAWIFPGNDKLWKSWWGTFSKLLMMFPLIMLIIGIGRIFALLLNNSGGGGLDGAILNPIAKLGAYMLPYAFIPFTFKFAGGLFANLAGVVNDRNKGLFDRAKKRRAEKLHRTEGGNLFRNAKAGSLRARANRGLEYGFNASKAGVNPLKMKSRMQAALSNNVFNEAKELLDKNADMAAIKGNEDFLEAGRVANDFVRDAAGNIFMVNGKRVRRDGSEAAAQAYLQARGYAGRDLDQAVSAIRTAKRAVSSEAFNVAATLAIPSTGTGFASGAGEMDRAIVDATEGDMLMASRMLAEMRGSASNARRPDLAGGGYGNRLAALRDVRNAVMAPGATEATIQAAMDDVTQRIDRESLYTQSGGAILTMKAAQLRDRVAPMMVHDLQEAIAGGDDTAIKRQVASIQTKHEVANQVAPESAQVLADEVMSQQVDVGSLSDHMRQLLANYINETAQVERRDASGAVVMKDGRPIMDTVVTGQKRFVTVQQLGEALDSDAVHQEARRSYKSSLEASLQRPPDADPGSIPTIPGTT